MAHAATEIENPAPKVTEKIMENVNNVLLAGLGVVASAQEKSREVYDSLVDKGRDYKEDESRLLSRATHDVKEFGQSLEERIQRTVTSTLNRAGVPSRSEIQDLIHRVETLTRKVDKLAAK